MASRKKSFGTFLLLLAFAKVASSSSDDFVDQVDVASQAENPRWARAANSTFDDFVDQMTAASKVFAGISLETGFLDDSIPSDAALAELLNLKNADLAKLENFDNNSVSTFFSKLSNSNLADNNLETDFLTKNSWIQEHKTWKDPLNLNPVEEYLNKLDSLNKKNIVLGSHDDAITTLSELIPLLEKFRKIPDVPTGDVFQYTVDLRELKKKLEEIDQKPDLLNIQNFLDINNEKLGEYGHFEIFGLIKFREQVGKAAVYHDSTLVTALLNLFQSASSLSSELTTASPMFVELLNIFESFDGDIDRTHTLGLAGGFRDLKTIQASAKNPVFSSLIDNYDWKTVETALNPLVPLAKTCESLHNQWISAHNLNSTETIKSLVGLQQKLDNLQEVIQLGKQYLINVMEVQVPALAEHLEAETAAESLRLLKEKMDPIFHTIKEFVESKSFQDPSRLSELKNLINYSGNGAVPEGELQGVLTSMRTFNEIDEMIQSLKNQVKFYRKLNSIVKGFSFKTSLQEVVNNKGKLNSFVSDSKTPNLVKYLDELKKISDLGKIAEGVTTFQLLKTIKSAQNSVDNVLKASSIVALSSGELKTLRSTPNSIKQSTVPEVRAMLNLKVLIDHSRVFGKAAIGLRHLQKISSKEDMFKAVVGYGVTVDTLVNHVNDASLREEIRAELSDIEEVKKSVSSLKDALDSRRNSLNRRKRSVADFGQKFSKLGGLSDYNLNLDTTIKAIDKLKLFVPSPALLKFQDSLVELDSLDLHFAKYNAPFSAMPKVLSDIFKLFGAAAKKPVLPPPSGDPSGPAAAGGGQGSATTSRSWVGQSKGPSDESEEESKTKPPRSRNGQSEGSSVATTQAPGTAWWVYLLIAAGIRLN